MYGICSDELWHFVGGSWALGVGKEKDMLNNFQVLEDAMWGISYQRKLNHRKKDTLLGIREKNILRWQSERKIKENFYRAKNPARLSLVLPLKNPASSCLIFTMLAGLLLCAETCWRQQQWWWGARSWICEWEGAGRMMWGAEFMSSTLIDFHFIIAKTTHPRERERNAGGGASHKSHKFSHSIMASSWHLSSPSWAQLRSEERKMTPWQTS